MMNGAKLLTIKNGKKGISYDEKFKLLSFFVMLIFCVFHFFLFLSNNGNKSITNASSPGGEIQKETTNKTKQQTRGIEHLQTKKKRIYQDDEKKSTTRRFSGREERREEQEDGKRE